MAEGSGFEASTHASFRRSNLGATRLRHHSANDTGSGRSPYGPAQIGDERPRPDGRACDPQSPPVHPRGLLTCRGLGIFFDRERSAWCGSVASTAGWLHRHPTAYDKTGKRRANTPVALVVFLIGPSLKTDWRRAARVLKLVLSACTLAHLFPFSCKQNCVRKVPGLDRAKMSRRPVLIFGFSHKPPTQAASARSSFTGTRVLVRVREFRSAPGFEQRPRHGRRIPSRQSAAGKCLIANSIWPSESCRQF